MNFAIGFIFGFSLAVALICRVSLRPRARKVLSKTGIVRLHKARVPVSAPFRYEVRAVYGDREI